MSLLTILYLEWYLCDRKVLCVYMSYVTLYDMYMLYGSDQKVNRIGTGWSIGLGREGQQGRTGRSTRVMGSEGPTETR